MAVEEALAILIDHFGGRPFRVRDMSDDMVDEVLQGRPGRQCAPFQGAQMLPKARLI